MKLSLFERAFGLTCASIVAVLSFVRLPADAAAPEGAACPCEDASSALVSCAPDKVGWLAARGHDKSRAGRRATLAQLLPPLTARFEIRDGAAAHAERIVSRARDRVHVGREGEEWLFVQDPVTPARFDATRVLRDGPELLEYSLTALRREGVAESWAGVLSFGVEPRELAALGRTADMREAFGREFHRYAREANSPGRIRELWWCEELWLPLSITIDAAEGVIVEELTYLSLEEDGELLRDPAERFPERRAQDVFDWRETRRGQVATAR